MYNLRGNSRKVADQILEPKENLYEFLETCTPEQFVYYSGHAYKGTDLNGLEIDFFPSTTEGTEGKFLFKNYETSNIPGNQGSVKTCPDGYVIPTKTDMLNVVADFNMAAPVFQWNAGMGRQVIGVFSKPLTYKEQLFGNVNVYYSKAVSEVDKLVFYGLAIQNEINVLDSSKGVYLFNDLEVPDKIASWTLFNSKLEVRREQYSSGNTTRYIRCIKEPGFFIYEDTQK